MKCSIVGPLDNKNQRGRGSVMGKCEHHEICGRDADENTGDGLCILHSRNPEKDKEAFDRALVEHRDPKGPNKANKDNFSFFVCNRSPG